jgi:putative transcriptional regulator
MALNDPMTGSLAGHLLIAHPLLTDPNFSRSAVLVSGHNSSDGAIGIIINRPTGETLGQLRQDVSSPLLKNLPLYVGGPVAQSELLLVAWHWNLKQQNFRLYCGLEPAKLEQLIGQHPAMEARAFVGYAGWAAGQLEAELQREDWTLTPFAHQFGKMAPQQLWKQALRTARPAWSVIADMPDDPSIN